MSTKAEVFRLACKLERVRYWSEGSEADFMMQLIEAAVGR